MYIVWDLVKVFENEILKKLMEPPLLVEKEHFLVKFAENPAEIEAAKRLRYDVFMAEQGHMAGKEPANALDEDEFDPYCLHLIVVERSSQQVVATYRVHPGSVAQQGLGFYSEQEFKLGGLEKIADRAVEVGRSCVKPEFRNGAIVALLWAGMAAVHDRTQCRYLLGCVSLSTVDPVIGRAMCRYLAGKGDVFTDELDVAPQAGWELPQVPEEELKVYTEGEKSGELRKLMPPLMKGYLRLGARFGREPVLDKEFGAIDFLVLFNFDYIDQKYARHFL